MRSSDWSREENYSEYQRLLQDISYTDVVYDEESGGVSAVHTLHKFDKQIGVNGFRRGDYERQALVAIRKRGHRIILGSEKSSQGVKVCDGLLDDVRMEIKAVEGEGTWAIPTKLREAEKQHAECVVLFFPDSGKYSPQRMSEGIRLYNTGPSFNAQSCISEILAVVGDKMETVWDKKSHPGAGWSVPEGLRGQNGDGPLTIPPSDAKI